MDGSVDGQTVADQETLTQGARPRQAGDSRKSQRTRARILDTAMRLFAEVGYHPASNAVIAEASGLTRGAMLYHFASREALLDALIPHIEAARARLFESAADETPPGSDRTDHAIDAYWRLLHETPFIAFNEMEAAARTDATLRDRLRAAQAAFDRLQVGEHTSGLMGAGEAPRLQASRDLARFVLEGLSKAHLAYDGDARTERLLGVVKRAAHMLNRKGSIADLWS
ncbi:TetR/AcrR family transcriptional regulator [Caulobacter sp. S45]|jgi:AcrR family transcriptional regulator|uniref:TetR/AcrR family transcriptional regulator n=1 Tax=Caulobacter sp. S45 TaxID=1641861 RepID=UPI002110A782|nr:TetR/AcrR family transcriptional regulator [Caulobacter sp. S45]